MQTKVFIAALVISTFDASAMAKIDPEYDQATDTFSIPYICEDR